jgi:hypothetical protein
MGGARLSRATARSPIHWSGRSAANWRSQRRDDAQRQEAADGDAFDSGGLTSPTRTRQGAHEKGGNALGATRKQLLSRTSVKIIGLFDGKINPCRAKSVQFRMSAARELMVVD